MLKLSQRISAVKPYLPSALCVAAIAILAIGILWGVISADGFRNCLQNQGQYPGKENNYNKPPAIPGSDSNVITVWSSCAGGFSNENAGAITAVATVVLTLSTIALWLATLGAAKAAKGTAETATTQVSLARDDFTATHRPWVGVTNAVITGPLTWDGGGNASLRLEFSFKNFGPSPALRVFLNPKFYPHLGMLEIDTAQAAYMESIRNQVDTLEAGYALFPEQDGYQTVIVDIRAEDIRALGRSTTGLIPNLMPVIIGSIEYRFPFGEPDPHYTQFVYQVRKRCADGSAGNIDKDGGDIPVEKLLLIKWITGWHAD